MWMLLIYVRCWCFQSSTQEKENTMEQVISNRHLNRSMEQVEWKKKKQSKMTECGVILKEETDRWA